MTTLIPQFDLKNGGTTPTGAVNRAINLKLAETVSVLDFGADPTGTTDSTTAIQDAVNSSLSVYFPVGTYLIAGSISLKDNSSLFGYSATLKKSGSTATAMISALNVDNILIDGLNIDGNYTIQAVAIPTISFENVTNGTMRDMNCVNIGSAAYRNGGTIQITNCIHVLVDNITINVSNGACSIFVDGSSGNDVTVQNCHIYNSQSDSAFATEGCDSVRFLNNYCSTATASVISFNSPNGTVAGNLIVASALTTFYGITIGHAVAGQDASYTKVHGNIVFMSTYGTAGIGIQSGDRNTIIDNYIYGSSANAGVITDGTNTIITNNTVVQCGIGISAAAASTNVIASNNNLSNFLTYGIISQSSCVLTGNRLKSALGTCQGIQLNAIGNTVTGNYINVVGTTVSAGYSGSVDGGASFRGNIINDADTSTTITLGASSTSTTITNANIVSGGLIYLMPLSASFAARNAYFSSVSAGSATLTYSTGTSASCKVVFL
jgi:hypothetical protein